MRAAVRIQPLRAELPGDGGVLGIAELRLGGVPRGAVILLNGPDSTASETVEAMNGLAEHGYESIAHHVGDRRVTDDQALRDVGVLIAQLGERGWSPEQIGVVGYELGGRIALLAASEYLLGAAISVNPTDIAALVELDSRSRVANLRGLRTAWLGMFGGRDARTASTSVTRLARTVALSPVYTQVVSYPGVADDFYRNSREVAAHAASFDSWQRILEWLNARVVPRPTPLAETWRGRQLVS